MDWIKCTDRMPPKGKRLILTSENPDGRKTIDIAVWCGEDRGWLLLLPGLHSTTLADSETRFKIAHWMFMPEPAED